MALGGLGSCLSPGTSLVGESGATYCPLLNILFSVAPTTSRENVYDFVRACMSCIVILGYSGIKTFSLIVNWQFYFLRLRGPN